MKSFILVLSLLVSIISIEYAVTIPQSSFYCFTTFIPKTTPFHFRVEGQISNNYTITMALKNGSIITRRENTSKLKKIDSYATISHNYRFCIENVDAISEFHINFHQGLELGDLSRLPKMQDLRYVEQVVNMISATHSQLAEIQDMCKNTNEYSMQVQKLISFKTVGFGFLSLAVILIVSFLHYMQIKRVMRNRKII